MTQMDRTTMDRIGENRDKIILHLCPGTGIMTKFYSENGYPVIRVEIEEGNDVRLFEYPKYKVYGIFAEPPCTHLAGSGARWWKSKGKQALIEALSIADACMRIITITNPTFWVIENPVGRLTKYWGGADYIFQPYEYGESYSKKTCLWGKFNMPFKTPVLPLDKDKIWKMPPSKDRAKLRSISSIKFAKAFYEANQ